SRSPVLLHGLPCPSSGDHRPLHSFPTRRSSDLSAEPVLRPRAAATRRPSSEFVRRSGGPCQHRSARRSTPSGCRADRGPARLLRSEEHTSELQSRENLVCRLLLEKKKS